MPSRKKLDEIPITEVGEPLHYAHSVNVEVQTALPLDEYVKELENKKHVHTLWSSTHKDPHIVVISCCGILGDVMHFCQSLNHALFHPWTEDLAKYTTDVFSYYHNEYPIVIGGFLFDYLEKKCFTLRESFARYAGQRIINACCFSFEQKHEGEINGNGNGNQSTRQALKKAFMQSSFTCINITSSFHEIRQGELLRVDTIDLDGRVDTNSNCVELLFSPNGYTVGIPSHVHS